MASGPQKNFLFSLSKALVNLGLHLKQDITWLGIPDKLVLIKVSFPALDRVLLFQPASFLEILRSNSFAFTGSFQKIILWIPRYFPIVVLKFIYV